MGKYLSVAQIRESIVKLSKFHVFFGTTFLVLERNETPVGDTIRLSLDAENREHLRRYFRAHPKSDYFFTPFQIKRNEGRWREPKYASTSLQAINTQGFGPALLHEKKEKVWGWAPDYLRFLVSKLPKGHRLPLLHFAVWFERDEIWSDAAERADVQHKFLHDFHLFAPEMQELFDVEFNSDLSEGEAFQQRRPKWDHIIQGFGIPKDVPPEGGATLRYLEFSGLGPVRRMTFAPGPRLNVITGDNGLGKTFLLDIAWWALTQEWAEHMIVPFEPAATQPLIRFSVAGTLEQKPIAAEFDPQKYRWRVPPLPAVSGLVVYARVDGSFAIWDPANPSLVGRDVEMSHRFVSFSRRAVWEGDDNIEGLLRDWVKWQTRPAEFSAFRTLEKLIQRTKPPDLGDLSIGPPTRLHGARWRMEIPTLIHPYGKVPIVYESAGIRRILALAYLIVWAWEEHKIQAKASGRKEERQMVIILDEAEAHLHPRWQRVLLPSLLGIAHDLHEELSIQYFIASHSPMVLASAEPIWDANLDRLFHLRMNSRGKVTFETVPFEIRGTADSWLQSPAFDSLHPGSAPAERALRNAKELMKREFVDRAEVEIASKQLAEHLSADDPFWLRWILFAQEHGVEI